MAIVLEIGPHECRKETIEKRGVRMKVWSYCGGLLPTLLMLDLEDESPSAARYQRLGIIPVGLRMRASAGTQVLTPVASSYSRKRYPCLTLISERKYSE